MVNLGDYLIDTKVFMKHVCDHDEMKFNIDELDMNTDIMDISPYRYVLEHFVSDDKRKHFNLFWNGYMTEELDTEASRDLAFIYAFQYFFL